MIFKSEEPRIQRVAATEFASESIDPGRPFDYRKEITNDDITRFQAERASAEVDFISGPERYDFTRRYLVISAAMKQLDLFVPPLSTLEHIQKRVLAMLTHTVDSPVNAATELPILISTYLLDPSLFTTLEWSARRDLKKCFKHFISNESGHEELSKKTVLRLANYPGNIQLSHDVIEHLKTIKISALPIANVAAALEYQAYARILDIRDLSPLDEDDWKNIRNALSALAKPGLELQGNTQTLAQMMMHVRILNAKEISVDKDGLHIVDPDISTSKIKSVAPAPARKNI
jgi:hypothetical protein